MGLPIYNKEGEKSPLNSILLLLFLLKGRLLVPSEQAAQSISFAAPLSEASILRGEWIIPGDQLKALSFSLLPLVSGLRVRLIKLHRKTRGQHSPSSVCQQLRTLIFALELTDTGEAGLGEATSGSVLRALCGKGAPRAQGSGVLRGISQSIPGELRVRRGTQCWAAFAKYPKARQAPWARTGDARPGSRGLSLAPAPPPRPSLRHSPPALATQRGSSTARLSLRGSSGKYPAHKPQHL